VIPDDNHLGRIFVRKPSVEAAETNRPPQVSVTWPYPGTWWTDTFSVPKRLILTARAQVQFFIEVED